MKKLTPWLIALLFLGGISFWVYKAVTKPLPGEEVADMGAEHLTDIAEITYNSNPPTSGAHFPIWAKPGVYDRFISDGYFIHSMEHGYIIIWYDCNNPLSINRKYQVSQVSAHEGEEVGESTESGKPLKHMTARVSPGTSWITPETQPEVEVELPDLFKTEECKNLATELSAFTKIAQRVIVAPKQGLETPVALTAWGRILKLQNVDKEAIETFIKTFHNRGPEQTME